MEIQEVIQKGAVNENNQKLLNHLQTLAEGSIHLKGLVGSSVSFILSNLFQELEASFVIVLPDKESAAYFLNDLESIFNEKNDNFHKKKILFFPATYKRTSEFEKQDNTSILLRTEVLKRLGTSTRKSIVVTYPEALAEKVIRKAYLSKNTIRLKRGEATSLDFMADLLIENDFDRVDFVYEPGQFAIRGGIIDVFSYTNDFPYRIEFFGEEVESIRSFNPNDQLSIDKLDHITIVPNLQDRKIIEKRVPFLEFISSSTILWAEDLKFVIDKIGFEYDKIKEQFENSDAEDSEGLHHPDEYFVDSGTFREQIQNFLSIEFGSKSLLKPVLQNEYLTSPQPSFNKNFDLLIADLTANTKKGYQNIILSENPNQIKRLYAIFDDIHATRGIERQFDFETVKTSLHQGFIDHDNKQACYTDHQIFERYHKYHLKEKFTGSQALTLKEIYDLQPGDYVTHIDHGVGRFDGLEKVENNGKVQEAIRLIYSDGDLLYISIHSLHRISKFVGKEGIPPKMHRLGSNMWNTLKAKTKKKVKDIAKELIKLYAERKSAKGFAFSPDTYLQHELEASFIYEDTPDQLKSTQDVKQDMEVPHPMDRLVCGDVGFGKTEVAIRAAFKAVTDSKQVAVLVPTTILALQHYNTFSDRLGEMPVKVEYINRFKSTKQQSQIKQELKEGKIDILIGTHRLISKDIEFKNLGLLIIDEEQKFGVSTKEKLKRLKVNVDTLTLTATPIPRTLQFSLMGARDLSIINTPPPNRYPVLTEIRPFGEEVIRDAINYEVDRGGQVFFVHNRVQNIEEVADMIRRFCPDVSIAIGHGQMEGHKLEKIMLEFISGKYDVLLATTIIESGLDIPNVNTIIINEAQNFGLSDLHQLRGRVGRANRKAFCYLLSQPLSVLTPEARKRLKAIEELSELGSGFNIAMRDLDIRGAGNILGAEQSGFISDIGFEMYHKILDEAIMELKETEFKDLYTQETHQDYVRDCQIETDLALLFTDDYITNITERLSLYKELDNIQEEVELQQFRLKLIDRFGPMPPQTEELIQTIRLRWLAKDLGFEKIIMKNERMTGYFISNQESPYYQSEKFTKILRFVQANPRLVRMKESKDKLSMTFLHVDTVSKAIGIFKKLIGENESN
ncbi:MAG: transcription-repair coupling factor [Bacteroidales bacterium]|nr:transcription-repair coupling factor [Bacteroidales bacterium]MCF8403114.1 transcription-repair coupling factor [Bacteroidales bacterium]